MGLSASLVADLDEQSAQRDAEREWLSQAIERLVLVPISRGRLRIPVADLDAVLAEGTNAEKKHPLHRVVKKVLVHDRDSIKIWCAVPDQGAVRAPLRLPPHNRHVSDSVLGARAGGSGCLQLPVGLAGLAATLCGVREQAGLRAHGESQTRPTRLHLHPRVRQSRAAADGRVAPQAGVLGAANLSHPAGAQRGEDLVRTKVDAGSEVHSLCSSVVQLVTTTRCSPDTGLAGVLMRKRWPSRETAQRQPR